MIKYLDKIKYILVIFQLNFVAFYLYKVENYLEKSFKNTLQQ